MSKGFHKVNWSKKETGRAHTPVSLASTVPPSLDDLDRPLTDREFQIAVAQQQTAYVAGPTVRGNGDKTNRSDLSSAIGDISSSTLNAPATKLDSKGKRLTIKRSGGGKTWEDPSLLEWNPEHFRLFVGNLSGEVTDEMLQGAFGKYASMSRVKAVMDSRTERCKGFGFVSFASADDYFRAFKELNGKYIGNHPIQLKKATTELKTVAVKSRKRPYDRGRK